MITREGFYAALENMQNVIKIFRQIEDGLHTDLGDSLLNDMLEEGWDAFTNLVFGKDEIDEQIIDVFFGDPVSFRFTDDENNPTDTVGVLPYDKYYEFFVERRLEDEWLTIVS